MSETANISIAMALYNGERFVAQQLESFANQTRLPDELVVSDDASNDRGVEIVRGFAERAPFPVRLLVNDRNLGCTKNFERAIQCSEGDIIFTSDWDDVWYPQKLKLMEKALLEAPSAGLAICSRRKVNEGLGPIRRSLLFEFAWKLAFDYRPWCGARALAKGSGFNHSIPAFGNCIAFRASLKPLVLPFPSGDEFRRGWWDFFLVWGILCSGAGGLVLVPNDLVAYRQHSAQYSAYRGVSWLERMQARATKLKRRPTVPFLALIERASSEIALRYCVNPRIRSAVLTHWRARCYLPSGRFARIPVILRELASLRYHRFSSGFLTALKDTLFIE